MGSKLTKAKKKGEGEEQLGQVNKDWSTSTWPRKKKPDFNEFKEDKSGTLGMRGKFGKGSTATLGNDSKLERKPSFGKRMRASARNWASTKGLYKGSKNQPESEADTKPSSVILGQEEEKELEEQVSLEHVEEKVATSSELDVGALVKELVTQKLKKSKEKAEESSGVKVEAQIEDNNEKISPKFIEIDSNTAVTTEVNPAENVSRSVCEEDVTAIELIEPGDEIVIATETIVEENDNSYTEEKIEVIEFCEKYSLSKRTNSHETLSDSVEEEVTAIDLNRSTDEITNETESVDKDSHNIKIIDHINYNSDNTETDTPAILDVSSLEMAEDIENKEETLETSEIGQKYFEKNEVPAEVHMEEEANMDCTTPEISHETEIEEASTIPVKTKVEGNTENTTAVNSVNIEDISVIVEDILQKKEVCTMENEENVLENDTTENLDISVNEIELENIQNNFDIDPLSVNKTDDIELKEETNLDCIIENEAPPTQKIDSELNKNASEKETKEAVKDNKAIIEETNGEKEKTKEGNMTEQFLSNLNNQELKYITEIEEDNSLETVQEIESFELNEEIQEVRFAGSEEFAEIEDQLTRESLTQFEDTPVLETVEEMEEPPMEETETVEEIEETEIQEPPMKGTITVEEMEEPSMKEIKTVKEMEETETVEEIQEPSANKTETVDEMEKPSMDKTETVEEMEETETVQEIQEPPTEGTETIEEVVEPPIEKTETSTDMKEPPMEEIAEEMGEPSMEETESEVEQQKVSEKYAKVEETSSEEMITGLVTKNTNDEEVQDMSDNEVEVSKQMTTEIRENEESGESEDNVSFEDNLDAQEELILSEAEEVAQNILDRVFSDITDSAYFEGDEQGGITAVHENILEDCVQIGIDEIVESEYLSSVEENINKEEEENSENEITKDEYHDDSLLDGQNTTPNNLELVEEVKEDIFPDAASTLKTSTALGSKNDINLVRDYEDIEQVEKTDKKFEKFQKDSEDQTEEDPINKIEEGKNVDKNQLDEENELLSHTMQDLSGKLGNTLKLVQEHISVTSGDIVEIEKSKPSDSDFSNLTNTNIDYEVSEDGSDEERTDVSTDEGIVASSDEDEKCHGTKEAIEKLPKNKEDVKDSLDTSCREFK